MTGPPLTYDISTLGYPLTDGVATLDPFHLVTSTPEARAALSVPLMAVPRGSVFLMASKESVVGSKVCEPSACMIWSR